MAPFYRVTRAQGCAVPVARQWQRQRQNHSSQVERAGAQLQGGVGIVTSGRSHVVVGRRRALHGRLPAAAKYAAQLFYGCVIGAAIRDLPVRASLTWPRSLVTRGRRRGPGRFRPIEVGVCCKHDLLLLHDPLRLQLYDSTCLHERHRDRRARQRAVVKTCTADK